MTDLFPPARVGEVRLADKIEELTREISVRKRVYARWVEAGRLDGPLADFRITVLKACLADYKKLASEATQPRTKDDQEKGQGPG